MQVKVSCPIRHCRFGTFHVDRTLVKAQLEHHQQQSDEGVIDLCGDEDGTAIKTGKNAEGEGKPANNNIKTNGFIGKSTKAYMRIYPDIVDAVLSGEECTITYRDFAESLILTQMDVSEFFGGEA